MTLRPACAAAVPVVLGLAACGHSAPTTLHGLVASPPATVRFYAGPPVRVDAVRLPPSIDRIELLAEGAPGRFAVREFDRWAAPPSRLARNALAEDLAMRLPQGAVLAPGAPGGGATTAISLAMLSLSAGPATSRLTATWTRRCEPGGDPRSTTLSLDGPPGDAPEALSALLSGVADRIAADLEAAPDQACSAAGAAGGPPDRAGAHQKRLPGTPLNGPASRDVIQPP